MDFDVHKPERKDGAHQSSGLKSPIDQGFHSGDIEFVVAGSFEDPYTSRFPGRRIDSKIKDSGSGESA